MNNPVETIKQSKVFFIIIGFVLILLIGLLDYVIYYQLDYSIFYLIPIALITWMVGRNAGIVMTISSAIAWIAAERLARKYDIELFILYWNSTVRFGFFMITALLLAKLKIALDKEKILARKDFLTDIPNTQAFFERTTLEIGRYRRYKKPFTIAYLDCDNFKVINDHFGFSVGDTVLRSIANTIQNNIRSIDMVARIGGDEFLILLPETGYESAESVIIRIQKQLLETMQKNNYLITFTVGIAIFINPLGYSIDDMIMKADNLMYSAKKEGKNKINWQIFGESPLT